MTNKRNHKYDPFTPEELVNVQNDILWLHWQAKQIHKTILNHTGVGPARTRKAAHIVRLIEDLTVLMDVHTNAEKAAVAYMARDQQRMVDGNLKMLKEAGKEDYVIGG